MAISQFFNRIIFNATSGGAGDFVVAAAVDGYRVPSGNVSDETVVSYTAETSDKLQWETGQGSYDVGTNSVRRTTVRENSLGDTSKIVFSSAPIVRLDFHAQDVLEFLQALVTTQFDKTSDTVLSNVTGLSLSLRSGVKYRGRATLYTTMNGAVGFKLGMDGTVGFNAFRAHALPFIGSTTILNGAQVTAFGQITSAISTITVIEMSFYIDVSTAGTLNIQFSQGSSSLVTSSVLVGSNMTATPVL